MTLRLVGTEPLKPKRRRGYRAPRALSKEAQDRVRAAMRSLYLGHGGWEVIASLTGVHATTLVSVSTGKMPVSSDMLVRIAEAGGLSLDALVRQKLTDAGRCASCGARRVAS